MSKRFLILAAAAFVSLAGGSDRLWARGFGGGGYHGGGFGGGYRGGDLGGYRGGDFAGGREDFGGNESRPADGGYRGYQAPMGRDAGWGADQYANGRDSAYRAPTNGELNHFLGLPSDQGFHQMTRHPAGVANNGGQRAAGNPNGQWNHPQQQAWANGVRNNFNNWNGYNAGWYGDHPGAWAAADWGVGAAWNTATWAGLGDWFGGWNASPIDYAYGSNIAYNGDQVYIDGQDAESAADYYDQVAGQAEDGADADANVNGQWLPLGVFAVGQPGQGQTKAVIQLAVDKEGIIRGNYTDTVADKTSLVQGAVDEKTQRAAWTIGDDEATVMETGLYNLTQPEAPIMIHFGSDRTQQWTLVRLNQDGQSGGTTANPPAPSDAGDR